MDSTRYPSFAMSTRLLPAVTRLTGLLCGLCALTVSHAAEPQAHWLQDPCALLQEADYARVLPAPTGELQSKPYVGRRNSECLWTDAATNRTLRLVLHPARDAARVADQLQRMQSADPAVVAFEAGFANALITGDRTQVSLGVGHWMISVFGSEPLDEDGARVLATQFAERVSQEQAAP
jgi:hypothetical protein